MKAQQAVKRQGYPKSLLWLNVLLETEGQSLGLGCRPPDAITAAPRLLFPHLDLQVARGAPFEHSLSLFYLWAARGLPAPPGPRGS